MTSNGAYSFHCFFVNHGAVSGVGLVLEMTNVSNGQAFVKLFI